MVVLSPVKFHDYIRVVNRMNDRCKVVTKAPLDHVGKLKVIVCFRKCSQQNQARYPHL